MSAVCMHYFVYPAAALQPYKDPYLVPVCGEEASGGFKTLEGIPSLSAGTISLLSEPSFLSLYTVHL